MRCLVYYFILLVIFSHRLSKLPASGRGALQRSFGRYRSSRGFPKLVYKYYNCHSNEQQLIWVDWTVLCIVKKDGPGAARRGRCNRRSTKYGLEGVISTLRFLEVSTISRRPHCGCGQKDAAHRAGVICSTLLSEQVVTDWSSKILSVGNSGISSTTGAEKTARFSIYLRHTSNKKMAAKEWP